MPLPKNIPYVLGRIASGLFSLLFVLCLSLPVVYAQDKTNPAISGEKDSVKRKCTTKLQSTYTIPSINYHMVYIPPGTFMMGSPLSEKGRYDDEEQHKVTLTKGCYIGVTEITQGQWKQIMGDNPSRFEALRENHPVDLVSWNDCQDFIMKLSRKEKSLRYRLPTEAEWEYACRAGSGSAFTNGAISQVKCGNDPNLDKVGWYCGNTKDETQPVSQKEPNAWGLYDMHGNAWEWCRDWYEEHASNNINPKGPAAGTSKVFRGGGWGLPARSCRSAFRDNYAPDHKCKLLGFRLVREAEK